MFTQTLRGLDVARDGITNMAVTNVELLKLGLRIRAFRKVSGRSQKDFAEQCGLDRSYFGGVERGERNLTFFSLCQICAGLNCDIAAVTTGIPYPRAAPKEPERATLSQAVN
jgi:transcriptional regulator with XRE-family HTH domain